MEGVSGQLQADRESVPGAPVQWLQGGRLRSRVLPCHLLLHHEVNALRRRDRVVEKSVQYGSGDAKRDVRDDGTWFFRNLYLQGVPMHNVDVAALGEASSQVMGPVRIVLHGYHPPGYASELPG